MAFTVSNSTAELLNYRTLWHAKIKIRFICFWQFKGLCVFDKTNLSNHSIIHTNYDYETFAFIQWFSLWFKSHNFAWDEWQHCIVCCTNSCISPIWDFWGLMKWLCLGHFIPVSAQVQILFSGLGYFCCVSATRNQTWAWQVSVVITLLHLTQGIFLHTLLSPLPSYFVF